MALTEEDEVQLVGTLIERITEIKNAITQIETKKEAMAYTIGSMETLRSLAKQLLSPKEFKNVNDYIDAEINIIKIMIKRLEKIEGKY